MAKKKKQKKSGLAKRQQAKVNRKKEIKKKLQAKQAPPEKKITKSKLKKSLRDLPSLIFEPELTDVHFTRDEIEHAKNQHEKVPDIVDALATEEFIASLKEKIQAIDQRVKREGSSNKGVMTMAVLYFMEQPAEQAPASLNQVIVAIYYQSLQSLIEDSKPLDVKELNQKIQEYEETWSEFVQQKIAGASQNINGTEEENVEIEPHTEASANEILMGKFAEFLENNEYDDDEKDQIVEDVEVLAVDYSEEFGLEDISKLSPAKLRNFLESWFVQNMHPTKDDLSKMIDSLEVFFNYCKETETVTSEKFEKLAGIIQDKEGILDNLE